MLKGIPITLYERTLSGVDELGAPVYIEKPVTVQNVLIAPVTVPDQTPADPSAKKVIYQLGIPRGDTHDWQDARMQFFGQTWLSYGFVEQGISDLIPGPWDRKVSVVLYDQGADV